MFVFYDVFVELCRKKDVAPTRASLDIGLSKSAPIKWRTTEATPQGETLNKIAAYFGVSVDYLLGKESQSEELPALTKKDERDIARRLEATLGALEGEHGSLMFDGEPLDDETRELLRESLKNSLEWSKRMAKKKYTPKKYRKPNE